jgi:hypothetical protein
MEQGKMMMGIFSTLATMMYRKLLTDNKLNSKIKHFGIYDDQTLLRERCGGFYIFLEADGVDYGASVNFLMKDLLIPQDQMVKEAQLMTAAWSDIVSRKAWKEIEMPSDEFLRVIGYDDEKIEKFKNWQPVHSSPSPAHNDNDASI